MEKLLWVRHIHCLFNLRRKLLLTYFTDEETGLKKSGNLEKPGEVFNDIELVSTRTGIQTLGLTPEPSQLMTEEKMQSSSFCTVFFPLPLNQFPSPQIHSSPSVFCALWGGPLGTASPGLTCPLPTGWIWPTGGTGRKLKSSGEVTSGCIFSAPFPFQCRVWQLLCPFMVTAPVGQALMHGLQHSLGSSNTISVPWPRGGNGLLL